MWHVACLTLWCMCGVLGAPVTFALALPVTIPSWSRLLNYCGCAYLTNTHTAHTPIHTQQTHTHTQQTHTLTHTHTQTHTMYIYMIMQQALSYLKTNQCSCISEVWVVLLLPITWRFYYATFHLVI